MQYPFVGLTKYLLHLDEELTNTQKRYAHALIEKLSVNQSQSLGAEPKPPLKPSVSFTLSLERRSFVEVFHVDFIIGLRRVLYTKLRLPSLSLSLFEKWLFVYCYKLVEKRRWHKRFHWATCELQFVSVIAWQLWTRCNVWTTKFREGYCTNACLK